MVKELWRPLEGLKLGEHEPQKIYEVSNWGRVRKTTYSGRNPAGYRLKICWDHGPKVALLLEGRAYSYASRLGPVLESVWPELKIGMPRTKVLRLNALSEMENKELRAAWQNIRKERGRATKTEAPPEPEHIPVTLKLKDPWKTGEIPQRPNFRTPDPAWGF